jgi:hypothetical protein
MLDQVGLGSTGGAIGATVLGGIGSPGKSLGKLTYNATSKAWTSAAGLIYGQGSRHGNRVLHALAHGVADNSRTFQTVFNVPKNRVLSLLDEAWMKRGAYSVQKSGNWNYSIDMGRVIGTKGETSLTISVFPNSARIVTAYPNP